MVAAPPKSSFYIFSSLALSLVLHLTCFGALESAAGLAPRRMRSQAPLTVKIAEKKAPQPEPVKRSPPPPKPKPQPPKRSPLQDKPVARPVAGLSAESFTEKPAGATAMAAPAGNTMMAPDSGIRLRPDQIEKLKDDLSADPQLITETVVKPEYTPEALEAGFEGKVIIDVHITDKGDVTHAELAKKVGYGMQEKIIEMAMKARFIPRKNHAGAAIAGWGQIKVTFTLE
jgi:protein TonB